ncbi:alanine dehydrogenase [Companilactobacillus hulinensis]|uniref:alanine dehydrogenase n=1 Tax=Companilactobacillus hulinensis TaxID=2486007 RepID=UPI000F7B8E16|nr:alanine dehydrogenase [Companilactobacillus hulinensis]
MRVGVVKEQKAGEGRVAVTPENVAKLISSGAEVLVEENAGVGAGFSNESYEEAGGKIVSHAQSWEADLVVKVKEPDEEEYQYFKPGQVIWGFQHLASSPATVQAMMKAGTSAIGGETIVEDGKLALLSPMSAIAGRRSVIMGTYYLEAQHGGEGILLPGTPEVGAGNVVIFGGGNAALNAATLALNMGCHVTIIELKEERLNWLRKHFEGQEFRGVSSTPENLAKEIKDADLFISTILIPGARPPKLVTEAMVKSMKPGSVLVDVAIDQGGTVETIDHPTTIEDPVFTKFNVIHYAVPNQPGAVPRTATLALAVGNIKYLQEIVENGLDKAIEKDDALASGVNVYHGEVTNKGLADSLNLDYSELGALID